MALYVRRKVRNYKGTKGLLVLEFDKKRLKNEVLLELGLELGAL